MFKRLICGNFHHHLKDNDIDETNLLSPCSTTKKTKRKFLSRTKKKINPYANRGLDKFSALLADLEEKKQNIYTQMGLDDDLPLVRFVFSNSNECKTIVIVKKKQTTSDAQNTHNNSKEIANEDQEPIAESKRTLKKNYSLRKPQHKNLLMTMILILILLAIYGRSFAILCTSIGWYLVPSFRRISSSKHNFKTKKEGGI
ncbi:PREDICTED: uncharacterized protein LOC109234974 [Nicotiana attenuata]|uniref:ZCF37 n=1 Tax=Nicotiana attenuata TaxID=49451 RepID=A0A1J6HV23_NICAT|nr:PREDICTED: uncharacterized protein LOC109234974 [Nicotiana attenuata]OIS96716.1 hypothetical protein A4A49_09427 [Nicotiana attenuata]